MFLFLLGRGEFAGAFHLQIESWEYRVHDDVVGCSFGVRFDVAATVERFKNTGVQPLGPVVPPAQRVEALRFDVVFN